MGCRPRGLGAITAAISHPADPLICCEAPEAPDEVLTSLLLPAEPTGLKKILLGSERRRSLELVNGQIGKFYPKIRNVTL